MSRLKLAENDLGLTECLGPLTLDNAEEAATACGGAITPDGVAFPFRGTIITARWGLYLITDGLGWGVATHGWVQDHLS
jgi:hypothetical protein